MKHYISTFKTPDGTKWETSEHADILFAKARAGVTALKNDWVHVSTVEERDV